MNNFFVCYLLWFGQLESTQIKSTFKRLVVLHDVCYLNRRTYLVRKEEVQGDESRGESESGDLAEARRKKDGQMKLHLQVC